MVWFDGIWRKSASQPEKLTSHGLDRFLGPPREDRIFAFAYVVTQAFRKTTRA